MGNFEKLGILVIIVLVVVIIVVAAWGVRPDAVTENGGALRATVPTVGGSGEAGGGEGPVVPVPPVRLDSDDRGGSGATPVPPPPPPPPPVPDPRFYVVKSGDSLWKIADVIWGKGHYCKKIAKANPTVDPDNLKVGTKLVIPDLGGTTTRAATREVVPVSGQREYKIKPGDTLWDIAREELGRASGVKDIIELNPGINPSRLPLHSTILLPSR
jgi:nucleoid-associated protein YgaU